MSSSARPVPARLLTLAAALLLAVTSLAWGAAAPTAGSRAAAATTAGTGPVVRRGSVFVIRSTASAGPATLVPYGRDGDFPVIGDWSGNGVRGVGVVRGNQWLLRSTATGGPATSSFTYGLPGDTPVVGDWDGNGSVGIGVVRGNTWLLRNSASAGPPDVVLHYGRASDVPVTGDWDGDGRTSVGVVRAGRDALWLLSNSVTSTAAGIAVHFGRVSDRVVAGDWNRDGRDGIGVVRSGTWFVRDTAGGPTRSFAYGQGCDLPLTTSTAFAPPRGAGPLRADQRGRELEVLPTTAKLVALTFDAGANADALPSIIATLRQRCVPATFFLTGQFVRQFPAESARVGLQFPVGNHTQTHLDLTTATDAQVRAQVTGAQAALLAATRYDPRPMFRYPFGARDAHTQALIAGLGYTSVRWTVDTLGWQGTSGGRSAASVLARVLAAARPGEIVLMHVGSHPTDHSMLDAAALPAVIDALRARGYGFTTVDAFT